MPTTLRRPLVPLLAALVAVGALVMGAWPGQPALRADGSLREFTVTARKYAFEPAMIEVQQDDIVRVTFRAEDIAHSFTVDAYRIAKRVNAGQAVTFEFRADRAGTFPIYCALRMDEGCRSMQATLAVQAR
jgi:heme/copper-type cytochrome/quinol oxidase subunit 2